MLRNGKDNRDNDPADSVINDCRGNDDLTQIAPHEVHLAHHHRDDFDRRDRQRGAEEQRRDQPQLRPWQHRVRQHFSKRYAASEGDENAGYRNARRRATDFAHKLQIGLHAGQQQQHQHAELGNGIDHVFLRAVVREQRGLGLRPDQAKNRGAKNHTGEQLPDNSRLAHTLRRFSK